MFQTSGYNLLRNDRQESQPRSCLTPVLFQHTDKSFIFILFHDQHCPQLPQHKWCISDWQCPMGFTGFNNPVCLLMLCLLICYTKNVPKHYCYHYCNLNYVHSQCFFSSEGSILFVYHTEVTGRGSGSIGGKQSAGLWHRTLGLV